MLFLDSDQPIKTCVSENCDGCPVHKSLHCHFKPIDLIHFLFISIPASSRCFKTNNDAFVKSQKSSVFVIPANAGIQGIQSLLDSRVRGSDGLGDFLRDHQQ